MWVDCRVALWQFPDVAYNECLEELGSPDEKKLRHVYELVIDETQLTLDPDTETVVVRVSVLTAESHDNVQTRCTIEPVT